MLQDIPSIRMVSNSFIRSSEVVVQELPLSLQPQPVLWQWHRHPNHHLELQRESHLVGSVLHRRLVIASICHEHMAITHFQRQHIDLPDHRTTRTLSIDMCLLRNACDTTRSSRVLLMGWATMFMLVCRPIGACIE